MLVCRAFRFATNFERRWTGRCWISEHPVLAPDASAEVKKPRRLRQLSPVGGSASGSAKWGRSLRLASLNLVEDDFLKKQFRALF